MEDHGEAQSGLDATKAKDTSDAYSPPATPLQMSIIFLAVLLPNASMIICFSAMGIGLKVVNAMAPRSMNFIGNCAAALTCAYMAFLYIGDYHRMNRCFQVMFGALQFVLLIGTSVLKSIRYPWAPMMNTLLITYMVIMGMRASACRKTRRTHFYSVVGMCTLFCALASLASWVAWIFSGNAWSQETKNGLVAETQEIYRMIYKDERLIYEVHCKPGVDLEQQGYDIPREREQITAKCKAAATVWFLVWMAPFIASVVNSIVALFCFMAVRMGSTMDQTRLQHTLKRFLFLVMGLITGMYGSAYAAGGLVMLGSALMAFCLSVLAAVIIWLFLEVPSETLMCLSKGSKLTEYLVKAYKSDVVRAIAVIILNLFIPLFILLDMGRKQFRRCKGTTSCTGRYTEQGQKFMSELTTWNWVSIFTWVCILCEVAFVLNVGMKVTYVFFSWLNASLSSVPLEIVVILVFLVGLVMFLLPPVPGSAVYVFAGIVLGRKTQQEGSIGFVPGVIIASILGLITKLCACVGQYLIGYFAGKSVKVQQMIGVDKVFTRAIEEILRQPGLALGKVAILVGGPDWPTSVTCGILKLNIPQMLIGTVPVGIVSVSPQTLMGSLLTKEKGSESGIWTMVAALATGVSVVGQVGAMLTATFFTTGLIEKKHMELSKPRPEHKAVEELTLQEKTFSDKFKEVTNPYVKLAEAKPCIWFVIKLSVVLHLISFFLFGSDFAVTDPICFRKFAIINHIGDTFEKGGLNNNVLNLVHPLGWGAIALFIMAAVLHKTWSMSLTSYAESELACSATDTEDVVGAVVCPQEFLIDPPAPSPSAVPPFLPDVMEYIKQAEVDGVGWRSRFASQTQAVLETSQRNNHFFDECFQVAMPALLRMIGEGHGERRLDPDMFVQSGVTNYI